MSHCTTPQNSCCQSQNVSQLETLDQTHSQPVAEVSNAESQADQNAASQASLKTVKPRVELRENEQAYLIRAEMPGVLKEQVEITIDRDQLTLAGAQSVTPCQSEREVVYQEFTPRRFERVFRLSDTVDRSGVSAVMTAGVLTLRLPKVAEAQPLKVQVTG